MIEAVKSFGDDEGEIVESFGVVESLRLIGCAYFQEVLACFLRKF
jgi:hypothetical protein